MSSNLKVIREWIQEQTMFFGQTDELFITTFLEACDNDVEKTKRRIVRYYELRRLYPGLMTDRDFLNEKNQKMFHQKAMYSDIGKENYELPVVMTIKVSRLESDDSMNDCMRALLSTMETGLLDSPRLRKYGGHAIFDLENMKLTHILQCTPNLAMQTWKCVLEGLALKFRGLFYINVGSTLRAAINVGSLFLPTDIRNNITISSGSWDSIHDRVPPQCLPIEYGGTNGTLDENLELCEAIGKRWRDYLLDDERYGFNNIEQKY